MARSCSASSKTVSARGAVAALAVACALNQAENIWRTVARNWPEEAWERVAVVMVEALL